MTYDWLAGIVVIALIAGITKGGKWVAFKNADLERMRLLNIEMDAPKRKRTRYPPVMKGSRDVGTIMNAVFFIGLVPFFVTLNSVPIWRGVVDTLAILFVFDFFYYLTHRFIFHGPLMFKAHAVHHEAHPHTRHFKRELDLLNERMALMIIFQTYPLVYAVSLIP